MDFGKLREVILERDFYKRVVVILFATFILALNYNLFLVPNNLVIGGTSGLAIIFSRLFGWDTSVFLYVSSFVLLFFSFFCLGSHDTKISLVGGLFYPLMVTFSVPLALFLRSYFSFDNILLTILVSSFVYGLATGLIYKVGFNTGGADILVKIVNKFFHLPEGRCMFFVNGFIILFGGIVFGVNQVIYAILFLFLYTRIVDNILIGISSSKLFFIYTKEYESVRKYILSEMKTGVTILETHGGFSNEKGYMLMCVVPTRDYYLFKELVLSIDSNAFFVIHDCYEVFGGKRRNLPFI